MSAETAGILSSGTSSIFVSDWVVFSVFAFSLGSPGYDCALLLTEPLDCRLDSCCYCCFAFILLLLLGVLEKAEDFSYYYYYLFYDENALLLLLLWLFYCFAFYAKLLWDSPSSWFNGFFCSSSSWSGWSWYAKRSNLEFWNHLLDSAKVRNRSAESARSSVSGLMTSHFLKNSRYTQRTFYTSLSPSTYLYRHMNS